MTGDHTKPPPRERRDIKNTLELALLTAGAPLDMRSLRRLADETVDKKIIADVLAELEEDWRDRALQLIESAGGFQFISRPEYNDDIRRLNPQRPPRLSRALMEVLSIIAYRQPVTRGDVENLRSVAVSSSQLAFLEDQGWIEEVGRRETPGRPVLYATTKMFLDDLGLQSLDDLPPLGELEDYVEEGGNEADNADQETNGKENNETE